jgi:hypothetical protein
MEDAGTFTIASDGSSLMTLVNSFLVYMLDTVGSLAACGYFILLAYAHDTPSRRKRIAEDRNRLAQV